LPELSLIEYTIEKAADSQQDSFNCLREFDEEEEAQHYAQGIECNLTEFPWDFGNEKV
jgi:hypothetical protein